MSRRSGDDALPQDHGVFGRFWAELMSKPIVFGRGNNPINFVSVHDVAAVVERAVIDPTLRGRTLDVGGPDNLTFNQLASELQRARGTSGRIRHVPRWLLRAMSPASRRAAAAVAMDTVDLTFHPTNSGDAFVDLPLTDCRSALISR
jgi:NADH dehydrogenase